MSRLILIRPEHRRAVIAAGPLGTRGRPGDAGRGIESVSVGADGHLTVTYSDETTEDAGAIPGPRPPETDPEFTYTDGRVSRIDYASGAYKTFTYSVDGTLAAITQEEV